MFSLRPSWFDPLFLRDALFSECARSGRGEIDLTDLLTREKRGRGGGGGEGGASGGRESRGGKVSYERGLRDERGNQPRQGGRPGMMEGGRLQTDE